MKKVLLPVSEREYSITQGRLCYLIKSLAENFAVELLTNSKDVYEDATKRLVNCPNVSMRLVEPKFLPLSFSYRDDLAKIFIKYTKDIFIPDTDLNIWKTAAFDDFWGHISTISYPAMTKIDAHVVLLPLMSFDDTPTEEMDVFYTSITFMAKEAGIKVVGYQIYPVFNILKLMPRLMDGLVVKTENEREFFLKMGIASEKIHLLTDGKDIYSISTIEDTYENHIYNEQLGISRDELGILVCNHQKFRPVLKEIFGILSKVNIPIVLSLLKREYTVRELKEDEIIEGIYFDAIRKITNKFYLVENPSLVPITMISDVIISPTYITPLEFAVNHSKRAVVFNPLLYTSMFDVNGVTFVNNSNDLTALLKQAYHDKKRLVNMKDILTQIQR
jgi:hypothetical protein